ncbi:NO-inducible flavohemoprotein [Zavarzinia sp. CC-PAN008]|uniref:NO-inducible flavohemoprotein n=1 Tax=Zavarzinia sp. CC-PAN008 TaxID=3243332 RepID=UPI003F744A05
MAQNLDASTIALVKATVPALQAHGADIVREMYARLFCNAEIRALFNQSHQAGESPQQKALAAAVLAYAANIDNLAALLPAVERIAQKHVGAQIQPAHYAFVGEALLGAIAHVLGPAATPDILAAWGRAYQVLADVLIGRERALYRELAEAEGGWRGWRPFAIERITRESAVITSFVLRPVDNGPVLRARPGQYLTLWLDVPGQPPVKRTYSISGGHDGRTYRISVKREERGVASTWLHDTATVGTVLKVAPPSGDFVLPEAPQRPIVLLSGGVGLTPMVAMLHALVEHHPGAAVHFVHGTLDGASHALGEEVRGLAARHGATARVTTFYQVPAPQDVAGRDYDHAGLIGGAWLAEQTPVAEADYFLCGPRPFLRAMVPALARAGVSSDRIHYEFFGPADEVLAA